MEFNILATKEETAAKLADVLAQNICSTNKSTLNIAISGGTTPFLLFDVWAKNYTEKIPWEKIHFFWVDERCVEPTSPESNFGNTQEVLFKLIPIPEQNIHRIKGEEPPAQEALRYAKEIGKQVAVKNNFPIFDIILLGMGEDGHTASIFPPSMELLNTDEWVIATQNPYNQQNRITLSGKVINHARDLFFLVTGKGKAEVLSHIFHKKEGFLNYPTAHIQPVHGKIIWYFDADAAHGIV